VGVSRNSITLGLGSNESTARSMSPPADGVAMRYIGGSNAASSGVPEREVRAAAMRPPGRSGDHGHGRTSGGRITACRSGPRTARGDCGPDD